MEPGGILRFVLEKAWIAMKGLLVEIWILKAILVRAQKEKRRDVEKVFLRKHIIMKRLLEEIWTLNVILMKSQMEMKNKFLETGGKAILVISDKELG